MEKQDVEKKTCVRELYIDTDTIVDLEQTSDIGNIVSNISCFPDVIAGISSINLLAHRENMYPANPFGPLTYCNIDEINCIIIGDMPIIENITKWTGSGFSYEDGRKLSLHDKILNDLSLRFSYGYGINIEADNSALQSNGIILLHDVLSCTKDHPSECKKMWRPFIGRLLSEIIEERPEIPIVFTSRISYSDFLGYILDANNVFLLQKKSIKDGGEYYDNPKTFKYLEEIINKDKPTNKKISFLDLIEKDGVYDEGY